MLSPQAISTAMDQVANFEARNLVVKPLPGSVLDTLVRATHFTPELVYQGEIGDWALTGDSIAYYANTTDRVTGGCEHTLTQCEIANMIGNELTKHVSYARTVVGPSVDQFVKNLDEALNVFKGQIAHDFEIVTHSLPAPLADRGLLDSIEEAGQGLPQEFDLPILAISGGSATEAMRTGNAMLDGAIGEWVGTIRSATGDFVQSTWDQMFCANPQSVHPVRAGDYFSDTEEGNARLLLAYLFTRKLWDNPPEGTEVNLAMYNDVMSRTRDQLAARLQGRLNNAARLEKSGALIISSFGRRIVVNEPVYVKWLQSGGSNEVLFGNALSSAPRTMIEDIDAEAEQSKASWDRYAALKAVEFKNRMFVKYKEVAAAEFERTMAAATHEEMALNEREEITKRFNAELNCSRIEEIADVNMWALRLIAKSWYYKTDAYRILKGICDVRCDNPNLSVAEAGAISVINYISYWVASQMQTVRPANMR